MRRGEVENLRSQHVCQGQAMLSPSHTNINPATPTPHSSLGPCWQLVGRRSERVKDSKKRESDNQYEGVENKQYIYLGKV